MPVSGGQFPWLFGCQPADLFQVPDKGYSIQYTVYQQMLCALRENLGIKKNGIDRGESQNTNTSTRSLILILDRTWFASTIIEQYRIVEDADLQQLARVAIAVPHTSSDPDAQRGSASHQTYL